MKIEDMRIGMKVKFKKREVGFTSLVYKVSGLFRDDVGDHVKILNDNADERLIIFHVKPKELVFCLDCRKNRKKLEA